MVNRIKVTFGRSSCRLSKMALSWFLLFLVASSINCRISLSSDANTEDFKSIPGKSYTPIPVLCYHNINSKPIKEDLLRISEAHFDLQMKMIHDSGYHTISPDQLYQYLTMGTPLPSKPIMLTFDDTHE